MLSFNEAVKISQELNKQTRVDQYTKGNNGITAIKNGLSLNCELGYNHKWDGHEFITNLNSEAIYNQKYAQQIQQGKVLIGPCIWIDDNAIVKTTDGCGLYKK
jgi:hypothetical protein